jgi:integrase
LKAQGHDPAAELQQMRQRDKSDRFSDIAKTFLEKHASQNRTASETKRIIRRYVLPKWQSRSIHGIEKRDIIELIDAIDARGTPVMANRVLATLRKLFNWCLSRDIISSSPCIGIELPNKEKARDRVLTNSELVSIIDAARQFGGEYGKVIQMLFLTAQRRNEVSEMTWDELDLEQSLWTLPGERTKNEKPHFVHLSDQAKAILRDMPTVGAFVFTSNGATPFSGFSKAKKRLDDLSGVTDWRLHDIRRTVTTGMAMLRVPPHVADKIMNHQSGTISGVAAVYQRHEFLDERKAALDNWGNHVQSLVDGVDRDNVINMHKR